MPMLPEDNELSARFRAIMRSEEHTSELQSRVDLVCRLLREKKKAVSGSARAHRPKHEAVERVSATPPAPHYLKPHVGVCITMVFQRPPHGRLCVFFNDPATSEIYTLSLHDALPI